MKKMLTLVLVASFVGASVAQCGSSSWDVSGARSVIVDLRDQSELDQSGTLACAGHVPFNSPGDGLTFPQRFRATYGDGTGYDTIYLFCRSGGRAGAALDQLKASYKFGAVEVVNLGGYLMNTDWRDCGSCPTDCADGNEYSMRALTSGTGTRCKQNFSKAEYFKGYMSNEECNALCAMDPFCNFVTQYSSGDCYHTPECEVVNCAANIWQKDTVCAAPVEEPATEAPVDGPTEAPLKVEDEEEDLCDGNPFLKKDGFKPMKAKAIRKSAEYKAAKLSVKRAKIYASKKDKSKNKAKWQGKIDGLNPSREDAKKLLEQATEAKSCAAANRAARKAKNAGEN